MPALDHPEDYYSLITRGAASGSKSKSSSSGSSTGASYTWEERKAILEFQRVHKIHNPEVTMIHGSNLLNKASSLGQDVWVLYEQVCLAALHMGALDWAAHCIDKLSNKFSESKRVRRLYALYRESVSEWDESCEIYKDILRESPESTYARKRAISMKRQQGRSYEACEGALHYLQNFGTDKEIWHDLAQLYLEHARLPQALFCYEDLFLQDARHMLYILTYAELLFSLGQCPEHFEISRKYFCLALHMDENNLRATWGLFWCSVQLFKRDQGAEKILALQTMCANRLKTAYKKVAGPGKKMSIANECLIELIDGEIQACEDSLAVKKKRESQ